MRVTVIMCTWKRIHTLPQTIKMLEEQTYKEFDFVVWNNNQEIVSRVNTLLEESSLEATAMHWEDNIGGIGRFYAARKVSTPYVIFVDDDQLFENTFIETLVNEATPDTISGWWAWNILEGYHNRKPTQVGQSADYVGTGGMVVPQKVFLDNRLFEELPREYLFIEDLWLSRFFVKYYEGQLIKSEIRMQFMQGEDATNQHHNLGQAKLSFYNWLKTNQF